MPGEEVAAAKVLEPPGPGVVEEGGQAPDDDDGDNDSDGDGDEVTSSCVCEDTFFNVNCISYVWTPAYGWVMQVALVCSIPWPSRQIAPHSYL